MLKFLFIKINKLKILDINKLYEARLNFRQNSKSLNTSDFFKFQIEFSKNYILNRNNFNYKNTKYYHFLKNSLTNQKFEGNKKYYFSNPDLKCKRYMRLIDMIKKDPHLYKDFENFWTKLLKIYLDAKYLDNYYKDEITYFDNKLKTTPKERSAFFNINILFLGKNLFPICSKGVITNGGHRLALFKALLDTGYDIKYIIVREVN